MKSASKKFIQDGTGLGNYSAVLLITLCIFFEGASVALIAIDQYYTGKFKTRNQSYLIFRTSLPTPNINTRNICY
jgi:hypothetical protein